MKSPDAADRDRRDTTLAFVTLLVVGAALIRTAIFVALDDLLRAGWFVVVGFSALGIRQVNQTLSLAFRGNLLIGLLMITAAMEVQT